MGYNHLRANIRNAMVGMTVAEALEYRESLKADSSYSVEHVGYVSEFLQELIEEEEGCY